MANGQKRREIQGARRLEGLPASQLSSIPDPVPRKMHPMKLARNKRGFTLLEILVAITILAVGLLGGAGLTLGVIRGNLASQQITTATALAQDKMEEVKRKVAENQSLTDYTEDYDSMSGYEYYKRDTVYTRAGTFEFTDKDGNQVTREFTKTFADGVSEVDIKLASDVPGSAPPAGCTPDCYAYDPGGGPTDGIPAADLGYVGDLDSSIYGSDTNIENPLLQSLSNMKTVTVTVYWDFDFSSITLETILLE